MAESPTEIVRMAKRVAPHQDLLGDNGLLPTRERQRLETRERIYAVAESEIRAKGAAGTSVSQIARLAGVSRQTVYDHFPTTDHILAEALTRYRQRVQSGLASLHDAPTVKELLHAIVDASFAAMEPKKSRMRQELAAYLVRGSMVDTANVDPLQASVREAVDAAQGRGELSDDLEPNDVAQILLSCISGFLLVEGDARAVRAARAHEGIDVLLRGLGDVQ